MDRSVQISEVVAKTRKLLKGHKKHAKSRRHIHTFTSDEVKGVVDVLQETLKLLITHHDYFGHLELELADDFADLPNEIVHDVVKQASYEKNCGNPLENLSLIDGSWAEFGRKFTMYRSLRNTRFGGDVYGNEDSDEWRKKAPLLHESISLSRVPDKDCEILELMGTRFSTIEWCEFYDKRSELAALQINTFLKRQLKSKYLKKLELSGYYETEGNFECEKWAAAFVDFVKSPQFESLELGVGILLPFEVFEEVHKAWAAAEHFQVRQRKIDAMISEETFQKIENKFNAKLDDWIELKTVRSQAKMRLYANRNEKSYDYRIRLEYSDSPDTEKSDELTDSGTDCDSGSNSDSESGSSCGSDSDNESNSDSD